MPVGSFFYGSAHPFTADIDCLPDAADKPRLDSIDDLLKRQTGCASDRTFPDVADTPPHDGKCTGNPGIAGTVASEFGSPPV